MNLDRSSGVYTNIYSYFKLYIFLFEIRFILIFKSDFRREQAIDHLLRTAIAENQSNMWYSAQISRLLKSQQGVVKIKRKLWDLYFFIGINLWANFKTRCDFINLPHFVMLCHFLLKCYLAFCIFNKWTIFAWKVNLHTVTF